MGSLSKATHRSLLRRTRRANKMSLLNLIEYRRKERSDAWLQLMPALAGILLEITKVKAPHRVGLLLLLGSIEFI